jgi:hypothetical protein
VGGERSVLGRYAGDGLGPTRPVLLSRFPLRLYVSDREHHDELVRELSLLAHEPGTGSRPPALTALARRVAERYGASSVRDDPVRDRAVVTGEQSIDLRYELPESTAEACEELRRLLDEAEVFCRSEELLTMPEPPVLTEFRHWYLDQIIGQLRGASPQAWAGPLELAEAR